MWAAVSLLAVKRAAIATCWAARAVAAATKAAATTTTEAAAIAIAATKTTAAAAACAALGHHVNAGAHGIGLTLRLP